MLAENLISPYLPAANPTDSVQTLLDHMLRFNVLQLPVVEQGKYLGNLSRLHLEQIQAPADSLGSHLKELPLQEVSVHVRQHFFDVVDQMNTHSQTVVAVLNDTGTYMGAISQQDVVRNLTHLTASEEAGFVLVLEMPRQDYSLTEIAGIVESSNARILSLYLSPVPDSRNMYVNLKITGEVPAPIVLSFQRFGYEVAYVFSSVQEAADTQERFDALMRYLNI
ncbi:MAG: CBS domain-containing protein [Bacteroidetes bacterium]|nr:CBS domain-containing protein [Bacteroidota bacterium]